MTTTTAAQAKAQRTLNAVRDGHTEFTRTPGGEWLIVGPANTLTPGAEVTVTKADGTTKQVIIADAHQVREVQGVSYRTAEFRNVPAAPRATRPIACTHTDTDNNGQCYGCGKYVAGDDVANYLRRR